MPVLKPTRGVQLNKSHPLARGLVAWWPMLAGTGDQIYDLSGNGNIGAFQGDVSWTAGKFGFCSSFGGSGDYVDVGTRISFGSADSWTFSALVDWKGLSVGGNYVFFAGNKDSTGEAFYLYLWTEYKFGYRETDGTYSVFSIDSSPYYQTGPFLLTFVCNETSLSLYINGEFKEKIALGDATLTFSGIGKGYGASDNHDFKGLIDNVMIFNRALSALEIALLYREPFCVFENPIRPELIGSQIINLVGTTAALSSLSATAKTMRKVVGNVTSISDVEALLNSIRGRLETERNWLREALFNGMTANAFKLGTTLSLGWFWVRIAGCSVLYRGSGMEEIDFVNILAVAEQDACETSPPSYIPHNSGSTYFYVVRRFNNCGYQECTLAASVKVSIDSNGNLAEPQPNKVFSSKVEQVDGNKIQLVWFYCPLAQKSRLVCFNVYYDNRTGQINYQNPLATISYKGRKFHSFQSSTLETGKYLFAIRPEDASDIENSSLAQLRIQLDTADPEAVDILRAEAV